MVICSLHSFSQGVPPPYNGSSTNQTGGNAPIGGGLFILLGLGIIYESRKLYIVKKESVEE